MPSAYVPYAARKCRDSYDDHRCSSPIHDMKSKERDKLAKGENPTWTTPPAKGERCPRCHNRIGTRPERCALCNPRIEEARCQ